MQTHFCTIVETFSDTEPARALAVESTLDPRQLKEVIVHCWGGVPLAVGQQVVCMTDAMDEYWVMQAGE